MSTFCFFNNKYYKNCSKGAKCRPRQYNFCNMLVIAIQYVNIVIVIFLDLWLGGLKMMYNLCMSSFFVFFLFVSKIHWPLQLLKYVKLFNIGFQNREMS